MREGAAGGKEKKMEQRGDHHRWPLSTLTSTKTSAPSLKTQKKTGGFAETERRRVTFPEIPAPVLEHVCQYFYYKLQYSNA